MKENGNRGLSPVVPNPTPPVEQNNGVDIIQQPVSSSRTKQPRTRKLILLEKVVALASGLFSLVFYGAEVFINSGISNNDSKVFILKTIGIVVVFVISPSAVVFKQMSERYFEKRVIDDNGSYILELSGKCKLRNLAVCISGGLVVGGAAWSFTGLIVYSILNLL